MVQILHSLYHWFCKKYIDCVTTGKFTTKYGFTGDCPVDYQLISCNTYTPDAALDSWYMVSDGSGCYVQADNFVNQYVTGICCQLTEWIDDHLTPAPTPYPTS